MANLLWSDKDAASAVPGDSTYVGRDGTGHRQHDVLVTILRKVRFAIYLPTIKEFADVRLLADLASDAEEAGWDGV